MSPLSFRNWSQAEHAIWRTLYEKQAPLRRRQIVGFFSDGLEALGIGPERIPDLAEVNRALQSLTGFTGVPVEGLEDGKSFFGLLQQRKFPIGNFIRDARDLAYTPAPDVFHDLYGHIPFFANPAYAEFCQRFGELALAYGEDPAALRQFERLFWFTIEFGLVETPEGRRIFGAGIASSFDECRFALSQEPEVLPFDVSVIREQEYRIDVMQTRLFLLKSVDELYGCLDDVLKDFSRHVKLSPKNPLQTHHARTTRTSAQVLR